MYFVRGLASHKILMEKRWGKLRAEITRAYEVFCDAVLGARFITVIWNRLTAILRILLYWRMNKKVFKGTKL